MEDYIKNYIINKSRFFALRVEDGKGIPHQIVSIEGGHEEGGVLTETIITTWSDPAEKGGGHTWSGTIEDFRLRFKYIGFKNKDKDNK
jgi:hypothetical protein